MSDPFAKNQATSAEDAARIVPRAEFRVFGPAIIEAVKAKMWNGKTVLFQARRMPAETYFLSAATDEANVKVRDGLLDIKTKVEMVLDQDSYTIEQFIAMARRQPGMAAVSVEKMRYGFSVEGIICEYAQVWLNGAMVESACCESENYAGMRAVIDGLGLSELPNTNYLKAAKHVVGMI